MQQPRPIPHPLARRHFDLELDLARGAIRPCGNLDADTAPLALAAIRAMLAERPGDLTIDLTDVETIAEDGLDAIVMIAVAQHHANDNLALVNANAHIKRALLASGLTNLLDHASANLAGTSPD